MIGLTHPPSITGTGREHAPGPAGVVPAGPGALSYWLFGQYDERVDVDPRVAGRAEHVDHLLGRAGVASVVGRGRLELVGVPRAEVLVERRRRRGGRQGIGATILALIQRVMVDPAGRVGPAPRDRHRIRRGHRPRVVPQIDR